jgi:hypothetical protein
MQIDINLETAGITHLVGLDGISNRVSGRRTALTLGQGSEIHSRFKES